MNLKFYLSKYKLRFIIIINSILFLIFLIVYFREQPENFLVDISIYKNALIDFWNFELYTSNSYFFYTSLFFFIYFPILYIPWIHFIIFPIYYGYILYILNKYLPDVLFWILSIYIGFISPLDFFVANVNTFILSLGLISFDLMEKQSNKLAGLIVGFICFKPNVLLVVPFYIYYKKKINKEFLIGFMITFILNNLSILILSDYFTFFNHIITSIEYQGHYERFFILHYYIYILPIFSIIQTYKKKI